MGTTSRGAERMRSVQIKARAKPRGSEILGRSRLRERSVRLGHFHDNAHERAQIDGLDHMTVETRTGMRLHEVLVTSHCDELAARELGLATQRAEQLEAVHPRQAD